MCEAAIPSRIGNGTGPPRTGTLSLGSPWHDGRRRCSRDKARLTRLWEMTGTHNVVRESPDIYFKAELQVCQVEADSGSGRPTFVQPIGLCGLALGMPRD